MVSILSTNNLQPPVVDDKNSRTLPGVTRQKSSVNVDAGLQEPVPGDLLHGSGPRDAVSVELSVSHDVFTAVDDFFNMGKSGRFKAFHSLSPEDKEQFVKIVAELAASGYAGYEELVVNKKVERHDILTRMGDDRLRNARVYDDPVKSRR